MSQRSLQQLVKSDEVRSLLVGSPPESYRRVWAKVCEEAQQQKGQRAGIASDTLQEIFLELQRRPYLLCLLSKFVGARTFAEVGTAEGLQSFTFAEYVAQNAIDGGKVYTCDPRDVRNEWGRATYGEAVDYVQDGSMAMAQRIARDSVTIDVFWIDGSHEEGAVFHDVENLKDVQSDGALWVFDDYHPRFGCFADLEKIAEEAAESESIDVGRSASGSPIRLLVARGIGAGKG